MGEVKIDQPLLLVVRMSASCFYWQEEGRERRALTKDSRRCWL